MFQNIFRYDKLIVTSDSVEFFIHTDTKELYQIILTATTSRAGQVFLIAQLTGFSTPVVCKIVPELPKVKYTFVSPYLREIVCINDNQFEIIPINKFIQFLRPNGIENFDENNSFHLKTLGFVQVSDYLEFSHFKSSARHSRIVSAHWWIPQEDNPFIILVHSDSIDVYSVANPDVIVKSLPISDILYACYRENTSHGAFLIFTRVGICNYVKFVLNNNEVEAKISVIDIIFNPNKTIISQFSQNQSIFSFVLLQDHLTYFDRQFRPLELSTYDTDATKTTFYVTTRHLFYSLANGNVYVKFIKANEQPVEILKDITGIKIVSFQNDEIIAFSKTAVTQISLKDSLDNLLRNIIHQKQMKDAVYFSNNFEVDMQLVCQYEANEHVKSGDYCAALDLLQEFKSDTKHSILFFLQNGSDRFALQLTLNALEDLEVRSQVSVDTLQKVRSLLSDRIKLKFHLFTSYLFSFNKAFYRDAFLLSPVLFAQTNQSESLIQKDPKIISAIPKALQFRYYIAMSTEESSIGIIRAACKLDIPSKQTFGFSQHYLSLLNQYAAMTDTNEEETNLPICTNLKYIDEDVVYVSGNKLYINGSKCDTSFVITSIYLFDSMLYCIDYNLHIHRTDINRIDFIDIHKQHPIIKMQSNGKLALFLSISGSIFFDTTDVVDGDYVDIALGNSILFALDRHGDTSQIDLKTRKVTKLSIKYFTFAICASGDTLICVISKNQIVIKNELQMKIEKIDFKPELCVNGAETAYLIGNGIILSVSSNGSMNTIQYSQRIGNVLDFSVHNDYYVLTGSAAPPMKVYKVPVKSNEKPKYNEMRAICGNYPESYLIELFDKEPFRSYVNVMFSRWAELADSKVISDFIPYLSSMNVEVAAECLHVIINQGISISNDHLKTEYARINFLNHEGDAEKLSPQQLMILLPKPIPKPIEQNETLALSLLQKSLHSQVIPSLRFREGKLFVFSCGHLLNTNDMLSSVTMIQKYCESKGYPKTGKLIFDVYLVKKIPSKCPKCFLSHLKSHLP